MNNKQYGTITRSLSGRLVFEVSTGEDITHLFRKSMIEGFLRLRYLSVGIKITFANLRAR